MICIRIPAIGSGSSPIQNGQEGRRLMAKISKAINLTCDLLLKIIIIYFLKINIK